MWIVLVIVAPFIFCGFCALRGQEKDAERARKLEEEKAAAKKAEQEAKAAERAEAKKAEQEQKLKDYKENLERKQAIRDALKAKRDAEKAAARAAKKAEQDRAKQAAAAVRAELKQAKQATKPARRAAILPAAQAEEAPEQGDAVTPFEFEQLGFVFDAEPETDTPAAEQSEQPAEQAAAVEKIQPERAAAPGEPTLTLLWSEHARLPKYGEKQIVFAIKDADAVLSRLDLEALEKGESWPTYYKIDFDGFPPYIGRWDMGSGAGSLYVNILQLADEYARQFPEKEGLAASTAKTLEYAKKLREYML